MTAVCGTRNLEMVKGLGAHELIDYRKQSTFENSDGMGYDLVFDCVGERPLKFGSRFLPFMSKGAIYVTPVPTAGTFLRMLQIWRKPRVKTFLMKSDRSDLIYVSRLYLEGKPRPVIERTFSFDQLPQAFRKGMTGRTSGKIVVRVSGTDT